ncbi:MAG TPA: amidohydrolase family protein [Acidimicrobiales bacterium]|nr:amidohydrolase family protein [Acidimicrobiales bacterium]
MTRIDADAHVDETEDTWTFLEGADERFRPVTLPADNGRDQQWVADGMSLRRPVRNYDRTGVSRETSQLLDVPARLRHLDELRIDTQVLFPTAWIRSRFEGHEDLEVALTRSYNRWLATRTEESGGRLRWAALLPLRSMGEAVKELHWAKEHGAVGVFKKGFECGKRASDDYFLPLYDAADELDVPICIHTGSDGSEESSSPTAMDAVQAFNPLVTSGLLERYSTLRFGIIEAGASWIPFLLSVLAGSGRRDHMQGVTLDHTLLVDTELFKRNRIYVACQSHDDLPYILRYGMEDNLIVGTDYTHADQSAELKALDHIEARGAAGEISAEVARKILDDNPRRFYGL